MGFTVKEGSEKGSQKRSEKGVSRRCPERPLGECDPLGVHPIGTATQRGVCIASDSIFIFALGALGGVRFDRSTHCCEISRFGLGWPFLPSASASVFHRCFFLFSAMGFSLGIAA